MSQVRGVVGLGRGVIDQVRGMVGQVTGVVDQVRGVQLVKSKVWSAKSEV